MDISSITLIIVVSAAAFLLLARAKSRASGGSRDYRYQLSKGLLSKAERSFYGVLLQSVGNSGVVFSKVRVADVLSPEKGLSRSDWQRAFNAISSKHFDFIVCEPGDCTIKLAIELDDSSHGTSKAKQRDELISEACRSACLPLLRVKASKSYSVVELGRQIAEALAGESNVPTHLAAPGAENSVPNNPTREQNDGRDVEPTTAPTTAGEVKAADIGATAIKSEAQECPKCGSPMLLRKAKSGANAGDSFWGCSGFPKCRKILPASSG